MSDKSGEQDWAIAYAHGVAAGRERIAQSFDREAEWREKRGKDSLLFRSWAREIRLNGEIASKGSVVPTDADDLVVEEIPVRENAPQKENRIATKPLKGK